MSNTSGERAEFDFWEFVSCSKCRMPFALDNGLATVPFWLTECGHVICNNHLSLWIIISLSRFVDYEPVVCWSIPDPDQSCCQCGTQGVQVAPLQRQVRGPEFSELSHTEIIRWTHQCQNGSNLFLRASIPLRTLPRCMIGFSHHLA